MKDKLNAMRVFALVVQAKSFSAAADKLGMSKSLVSRHVSALERSLAVKLLNRSTRKLSVTDAGAILYEHCARMLQEAELAEQSLTRAQAEPAGLVKVTAVQAFAVRCILPLLPEFSRAYPKVRVKLACDNRRHDLGEEGFDLGIRVAFDPSENLVARKLVANRAVLCASPEYLKRRGTPRRIEDLQKHDCVMFPPLAPKGRWTLRREGRNHSISVQGVLETNDMDAVRAAVTAGLGIGILPTYMAGEALQRGELTPLLRQYRVMPESAIYLVYLPNRTLPSRVRALIDFLVERFKSAPLWDEGW